MRASRPKTQSEIRKAVYKPGPVPNKLGGNHSSRMSVARHLKQSTRTTGAKGHLPLLTRHSYLILLQVGFTLPFLLPEMR